MRVNTDASVKAMITMAKNGIGAIRIGREVGCSVSAVRYHLNKAGIPMNGKPPSLPVEYAESILLHHSLGMSNQSIAAIVRCSAPTVRKVLRSNGLRSNRRSPQSIEYVGRNEAKCSDCGEVKSIAHFAALRNGDVPYRRSYCGSCLARRNSISLNADKTKLLRLRLQQVKHRANSKGMEFDLDLPWTLRRLEGQKGLCFYTDVELQISAGVGRGKGDRDRSLSFDRVNNSVGYLKSNVVLAASRINHMKSDASLEEMADWMPHWHARAVKFLNGGYHDHTIH